ncbi:fatty acyl-AMP ligase [Lentzea tibetensis]|uniref:Fatty acyl-AMP ligase n=1 Tax=Lentzea tibetensis TaxID=2591470 RepID=A0A563F2T9_9PSEU|nr:fatty acyl-AMP ligase [Lentzea tibetensis]TWP54287.1 fatty acyl-AMP ligase [Lentzea tibetensis]
MSTRTRLHTLLDLCDPEDGRRAFAFFADGRTEWDAVTVSEVDKRARAIAVVLADVASPGTRALLCFEPGLDFHAAFLGCLYAGIIAVPVAPLDGTRTSLKVGRIESVVASCDPELLLSNGMTFAKCLPIIEETPPLAALVRVAVDEVDPSHATRWRRPDIKPETVAYLQYSSGSTGEPKGVALTHDNVLHNLALIHENLRRPSDGDGLPRPPSVSWLPSHYNMGLIGGVLDPLYSGRTAHLFPAAVFVRSPLSWLRMISQLGRADSCAPNFALDLCARRVSDAQLTGLDLSGWEVALIGGEPVRAATLDRFCEVFGRAGFRREALVPGYGLAESTVMVTCAPVGEGPAVLRVDPGELARGRAVPVEPPGGRRLVSSGPLPESVVIAGAAEGEVGEILVSGPSVGLGYWERDDPAFHAGVLRTGDLGFAFDGELFVTGRAKEVIIVAGANHHPHDLEATAEAAHLAIRPLGCCVLGIDDGTEERVVVLAEVMPDAPAEEVEMAVRRAVHTGHGVRVHEVVQLPPGTLPLTASGKLQRQACRATYLGVGQRP